jgi:MGT family glycosyltransferase
MVGTRKRFLFTNWEGGGHVDPALFVARECAALGHEVLFVSDEANRQAALSLGVPFRSWSTAPNRRNIGDPGAGLSDWKAWSPIGVIESICREVIAGPAAAYAADTRALIADFGPDLIVSNELLFGCMIAAEAARVPCALLTGNVWCFPTRSDVPPFGPGYLQSWSRISPRDWITSQILRRLYGVWTGPINVVREQSGLPPISNFLQQLDYAVSIVLGVSRAFDIGENDPPSRFFYAGPLIRTPVWASADAPIGTQLAPSRQPRILVSFSTTMQGQRRVIERCIRALARERVRVIVTLGPAVPAGDFPAADNVDIVQSASHDEIVPTCAAVVCHGGHGTMVRSIMHGVPLLCMPMGRDQHDNAARIVQRGAGLRLPAWAGAGRIRRAVRRLVFEPDFQARTSALGAAIRAEQDHGVRAALHLSGLTAG